ncbi:MAG: hypothetical protein ACPG7F_00840 [Aggregatilineales bacterium]
MRFVGFVVNYTHIPMMAHIERLFIMTDTPKDSPAPFNVGDAIRAKASVICTDGTMIPIGASGTIQRLLTNSAAVKWETGGICKISMDDMVHAADYELPEENTETWRGEIDRLTKRINELEDQVHAAEETYDVLSVQNVSMEKRIGEFKEKTDSLQAALDTETRLHKTTQHDLSKALNKCEFETAAVKRLESQNDELITDNNRHVKSLEAAQGRIAEMQAQVDFLTPAGEGIKTMLHIVNPQQSETNTQYSKMRNAGWRVTNCVAHPDGMLFMMEKRPTLALDPMVTPDDYEMDADYDYDATFDDYDDIRIEDVTFEALQSDQEYVPGADGPGMHITRHMLRVGGSQTGQDLALMRHKTAFERTFPGYRVIPVEATV